MPKYGTVSQVLLQLIVTSTNNKNGSRKLGYAKIAAETKARLSLSNTSAQVTVQTKGTFFLVKAFKGLAIFKKPLTKRL